VGIARGDMMDPASLLRAMDGADAVISTAAGYTRHSKGDTDEIDRIGNRNLAEAAGRAKVRRFVLTSILTCDQTPQVPHFWHKKLAEDRLEELGVPFVALRPGAFLDLITRMGDPFAKRQLMWFGDPAIPLTFVLTSDLAGYLADAIDAPGVDGQRIDIGWDRPVSIEEIAQIAGRLLGNEIRVAGNISTRPTSTAAAPAGRSNQLANDLNPMVQWFETGRYVANPARQREVFGPVPTAEDAIARLIRSLGHTVTA
jgi:uncharacterized protein YbjT (DUF2867 family)